MEKSIKKLKISALKPMNSMSNKIKIYLRLGLKLIIWPKIKDYQINLLKNLLIRQLKITVSLQNSYSTMHAYYIKIK